MSLSGAAASEHHGPELADRRVLTRRFEPLGMRDIAFWAADTDRLATAYRIRAAAGA